MNIIKFGTFACLLSYLFVTTISAQKVEKRKLRFTNKDKTAIIRQVFDDGFEKLMADDKFNECTIPIIDGKKIILIETNEPAIFPRSINVYSFRFMSEKEIEAEIKSNDGDCYLDVNLQLVNSNTVKISLARWINVVTVVDGKSWYPSRYVEATIFYYQGVRTRKKWTVSFLKKGWAVS
jgi:hypothetical protein